MIITMDPSITGTMLDLSRYFFFSISIFFCIDRFYNTLSLMYYYLLALTYQVKGTISCS